MITGDSDAVAASARRKLAQLEQQRLDYERKLEWIDRQQLAWSAGIEGEEVVAALLAELPSGWFVLHDRRKGPRSPANIDHLAIGPSGVHVIDAKNWSGSLWVGERGIVCGRTPRVKETVAVRELRDLVARELAASGRTVPVFGVIALASEEPTGVTLVHDEIAFVPPKELIAGLSSRPPTVTPEEAFRIWELLDDLHPPRSQPEKATRRVTTAPVPGVPVRGQRRNRARSNHRRIVPSKRSGLARPLIAAGLALGLMVAAPATLRQMSSKIAASIPSPTPTTTAATTQNGHAAAPNAVTPHRACDLISTPRARRLLGVAVSKVAVSRQACEFRHAGTRRPLAIVLSGPRVTDVTWHAYLASKFAASSCGTFAPTSAGGGVGTCVDPYSSLVPTSKAWAFDGAVVAAAGG